MKNHYIWTYNNTNPEDWSIDDMIEEYEMNDRDTSDITEADFHEWIRETNDMYLDVERDNLGDIEYYAILVIANLGLWNGRKGAYKIIDSGKVSDCLEIDDGRNLYEWYVTDDGEFCGTEHHHDGTNYMIYRAVTNYSDMNKLYNLLEKPMATTYYDEIKALTEPIGPDIANVYGWELKKEA